MEIKAEAKLMRIYVGSTDKFKHILLYEAFIYAAKRYGLTGATAVKGFMGYGSSSIVHKQKFWEVTDKVPVMIEIIDSAEKIDFFIDKIQPYFEKLPKGGLITVENAMVKFQKTGRKKHSYFK